MPVDKQLQDLLNEESLPPQFATWCAEVGMTNVRRFGIRVDKSEEVAPTIINECNAQYPRTVSSAGDIAGIKLVWQACRDLLNRGNGSDYLEEDSKPLSNRTDATLKTLWVDHHHFLFNAKHVVSLSLMNKLYKHATASPKQFVVLLPEEIKLRATVTKNEGDVLKVKKNADGSNGISTEASGVDPISSTLVFFKRVVALFNSWAYVSINDITWFSYQNVRDLSDILEDLIFRRVQNERAPLEFIFRAYLKTMTLFICQFAMPHF